MAGSELLFYEAFVSGPQIHIQLEREMEDNHAFC